MLQGIIHNAIPVLEANAHLQARRVVQLAVSASSVQVTPVAVVGARQGQSVLRMKCPLR